MKKNKKKSKKSNVKKLKIFLITLSVLIILSILSYAYFTSGYYHGRIRLIPIYGSNVITLDKTIVATLPDSGIISNASIVVLNKQEYPELYETWTVMFKTYGTSDLIIEGVDGTSFAKIGDNSSGSLDLKELRCGDKVIFNSPIAYDIGIKYYPDKIIISDYSCDETSYWTVRLLSCEKHRQKFSFGKSADYGNNACSGQDDLRLIVKDPDAVDNVQICSINITSLNANLYLDSCQYTQNCSLNVVCQKAGNYTARIDCITCSVHSNVSETMVLNCSNVSANKFVIKDSSGTSIAAFDDGGYLFHTGNISVSQSSLSPPANSFIIMNSSLATVAYINSTGELYLRGTLTENQTTLTPPAKSFIIRNSTGGTVAYIDSSGNMVLKKYDYELWLDAI